MSESVLMIGIDELMPDPTQPRKTFPEEEIARLAASIKARGILQPLRVLMDEDRKAWRIILGEGRWRAARLAGLKEVPCLPVKGEVSETDILADQIVENVVRHALKPLELARSLAKLKSLKGCNSQALAKELGLSGPSITRAESLLTLPGDIQALVDDGRVPESAAYEISRISDAAAQMELAQAVAAGRLNRDETADAVRRRLGKRGGRPKASRLPCPMPGGISITFSAKQPLTWEIVNAAIEQIRSKANTLHKGGKDIAELPRSLRVS